MRRSSWFLRGFSSSSLAAVTRRLKPLNLRSWPFVSPPGPHQRWMSNGNGAPELRNACPVPPEGERVSSGWVGGGSGRLPPVSKAGSARGGQGNTAAALCPAPSRRAEESRQLGLGREGTDGGQGTVGCTRYGGNPALAEEPPRMHRCCSVPAEGARERTATRSRHSSKGALCICMFCMSCTSSRQCSDTAHGDTEVT